MEQRSEQNGCALAARIVPGALMCDVLVGPSFGAYLLVDSMVEDARFASQPGTSGSEYLGPLIGFAIARVLLAPAVPAILLGILAVHPVRATPLAAWVAMAPRWTGGWMVLAAVGVADLVAIFAVPGVASVGVALVYAFAAFLGMGAYLAIWGMNRAVMRRRCTARVAATITGPRIDRFDRDTISLFTATFDYQGRTYEADRLAGSVTRAASGWQSPEPPATSADLGLAQGPRERLKVGDSCTLLVNPRNPAEAMYANEHNVAAGVASALLGTFMAALCGFGLIRMFIEVADAIF